MTGSRREPLPNPDEGRVLAQQAACRAGKYSSGYTPVQRAATREGLHGNMRRLLHIECWEPIDGDHVTVVVENENKFSAKQAAEIAKELEATAARLRDR